MSKVKICGIKRIEDVTYINEALPEYAGFVFWDKSKRNVTLELAKSLREEMDERIRTVGVFVNPDIDKVIELVNEDIISVVQLHGSETNETIKMFRSKLPEDTVIIKAFEVKNSEDIKAANESLADMVLIDSGKGSGETFDWNLLKGLKRDYFLAGGLSVENVSEAVEQLQPYAVDVSSKVETDGCKDRRKIIDFCQAVKRA